MGSHLSMPEPAANTSTVALGPRAAVTSNATSVEPVTTVLTGIIVTGPLNTTLITQTISVTSVTVPISTGLGVHESVPLSTGLGVHESTSLSTTTLATTAAPAPSPTTKQCVPANDVHFSYHVTWCPDTPWEEWCTPWPGLCQRWGPKGTAECKKVDPMLAMITEAANLGHAPNMKRDESHEFFCEHSILKNCLCGKGT
jgi:hypothetical protein